MPMTSVDSQYVTDLINAVNAYAVAMEMAAWSQATATTNAANLATALATAQTNWQARKQLQGV